MSCILVCATGKQAIYLSCHNGPRRHMSNLADGSSISSAKVLQDFQVLPFQIQLVLDTYLQLCCLPLALTPNTTGDLKVAL